MACDVTAGRAEPCQDIVGGIRKIYIINYTAGLEASATFDSDNQITAFGSLLTLFEYDVTAGTSDTFTETGTSDRSNGTSFFETSGTVVLRKQDKTTRKEMQLLQAGRPQVVTLDYNGDYRIYGLENGCKVTVNADSGAAMGDLNGYTLNVTAQEKALANFIDSAIIDDATNTSVTTG